MTGIRTRLIQVSTNNTAHEGRYATRVKGATGVVPFGRVDGHRAPVEGTGAHMLVGGVKAPILSVSLEHTVLDLSAVTGATVGQTVIVLGRSGNCAIAIEDVAGWQGVTVNDVLMALNNRLPQEDRVQR